MTIPKFIKHIAVALALLVPIHFAGSHPHNEMLVPGTKYSVHELHCLAKNIYHEARGEPTRGKIAVAQVTINRSNHPTHWPRNLCDVVYEQTGRTAQFSWINLPDTTIKERKAWLEARHVAYKVMRGELKIRGFQATYFNTTKVKSWKKKRNPIVIGNHVFYQ